MKSVQEILKIALAITILYLGSTLENSSREMMYLLCVILFLKEKTMILIILLLLNFGNFKSDQSYQITNWEISNQVSTIMEFDETSTLTRQGPGLTIKLLDPEFRINSEFDHQPPQLLVQSKTRVENCVLYYPHALFNESQLYIIDYTMVCNKARSNTVYQVVKFETGKGISNMCLFIGFCCNSKSCIPVLSLQINCNYLMLNSSFSETDIFKNKELQVLSRREIVEFMSRNSSANEAIISSNLKTFKVLEVVRSKVSDFRNESDMDISSMHLISDHISNTCKYPASTNLQFMFDEESESILQNSEAVIMSCVIAAWQYLMFFGILMLYIIFCWILLSMMIELFCLNFSRRRGMGAKTCHDS